MSDDMFKGWMPSKKGGGKVRLVHPPVPQGAAWTPPTVGMGAQTSSDNYSGISWHPQQQGGLNYIGRRLQENFEGAVQAGQNMPGSLGNKIAAGAGAGALGLLGLAVEPAVNLYKGANSALGEMGDAVFRGRTPDYSWDNLLERYDTTASPQVRAGEMLVNPPVPTGLFGVVGKADRASDALRLAGATSRGSVPLTGADDMAEGMMALTRAEKKALNKQAFAEGRRWEASKGETNPALQKADDGADEIAPLDPKEDSRLLMSIRSRVGPLTREERATLNAIARRRGETWNAAKGETSSYVAKEIERRAAAMTKRGDRQVARKMETDAEGLAAIRSADTMSGKLQAIVQNSLEDGVEYQPSDVRKFLHLGLDRKNNPGVWEDPTVAQFREGLDRIKTENGSGFITKEDVIRALPLEDVPAQSASQAMGKAKTAAALDTGNEHAVNQIRKELNDLIKTGNLDVERGNAVRQYIFEYGDISRDAAATLDDKAEAYARIKEAWADAQAAALAGKRPSAKPGTVKAFRNKLFDMLEGVKTPEERDQLEGALEQVDQYFNFRSMAANGQVPQEKVDSQRSILAAILRDMLKKYPTELEEFAPKKPGSGQAVGMGASKSFGDWLGKETGEIADAWGRGDYLNALPDAAMLPFEALNQGVDYGLGLAMGGLGRLTGQKEYNNWFGAGNLEGDLLDWEANQKRAETLNPLWRTAAEMVPQMIVPGKIIHGAATGLEAGMRAAGRTKQLSAAAPALGTIGRTGEVTKLDQIAANPLVQKAGKAAAFGAQWAAPVATGAAGWAYDDPNAEESLLDRAFKAGSNFLITKGIGEGVTRLGRAGMSMALSPEFAATPGSLLSKMAPETQEYLAKSREARRLAEGFTDGNDMMLYPGGKKGFMKDMARQGYTDSGAVLHTWNSYIRNNKAQAMMKAGKSMDEIEAELAKSDFYVPFRLVQGASRTGEQNARFLKADLQAKAGLRSKEEMASFEEWLNIRTAVDRATRGLFTNQEFKYTREVDDDLLLMAEEALTAAGVAKPKESQIKEMAEKLLKQDKAAARQAALAEHLDYTTKALKGYEAALGPEMSKKFETAARVWTDHFNKLLDRKVEGGLMTAVEAQKAKGQFIDKTTGLPTRVGMDGKDPIYAYMVDQTYLFRQLTDDPTTAWMMGGQNKSGKTFLTQEKGIDWEHDSHGPAAVTLQQMMEHFMAGDALVAKNKVFNRMHEAAKSDPAFAGVFRRLTENEVKGSKKVGTERVAGFITETADNGAEAVTKVTYEVPKYMHDALMGMTTENADFATRSMSMVNSLFRQGVTTLSIPFMARNMPRDIMDVLINNGLDSMTFKNYTFAMLDAMTNGRVGKFLERYAPDWNPWDSLKRNTLMPEKVTDRLLKPDGSAMTFMEEMMASGGGLGTVAENMRVRPTSAQMAKQILSEGTLDVSVLNPFELLRKASEISELASRGGVYRTARLAGKSREQAAMMARDASIDFSKSGNAMRVINQWVPLLNARVQGELRMGKALQEDPAGFIMREMLLSVMPTVTTFMHNYQMYNDAFAKTSQDVLDNNFVITVGQYTSPTGELKPINFVIPKTNGQKILTAPLEHFLNMAFRKTYNGTALEFDERNERDIGRMVQEMIVQQFPINVNTDELFDPSTFGIALLKGALQSVPVVGMAGQLVSNQDWRTGKNVFDPAEVYKDRDERADSIYGPAVDWLSEAMGVNPLWKPAPSQIGFAFKSMGGGLAQMLMGGGDVLVETLGAAPPRPLDMAALSLPENIDGVSMGKIAAKLDQRDYRPEWVRKMGWWFNGSGGAQTVSSKVEKLSQKQQAQWRDTQEVSAAVNRWTNDTEKGYAAKEKAISDQVANGTLTHAQGINAILELYKSRKAFMDGVRSQHPMALVNYRERKAFHDSLPGVPVDAEWKSAMLTQGEPSEIAKAAEEYRVPPALAGNPQALSNAMLLDKARWEYLNTKARELGIEPGDLKDQINALNQTGQKLPDVVLPALYLEELVNEYKLPRVRMADGSYKDYDPETTDKKTLDAARNAVVAQFARENGIPLKTLWERLTARLSYPEENTPMLASFERAMSVSTRTSDPMEFPDFIDAAGRPLGSPGDWESNEARLAQYSGVDYEKLPVWIRQLRDAKARGETKKLTARLNDPNYKDYDRWFGAGRNMSEGAWNQFQSGTIKKYTYGGPEEWAKMDAAIKLYDALPKSSPQRTQLAPQVKRYKSLLNKNYRRYILEAEMGVAESLGLTGEREYLYEEGTNG